MFLLALLHCAALRSQDCLDSRNSSFPDQASKQQQLFFQQEIGFKIKIEQSTHCTALHCQTQLFSVHDDHRLELVARLKDWGGGSKDFTHSFFGLIPLMFCMTSSCSIISGFAQIDGLLAY